MIPNLPPPVLKNIKSKHEDEEKDIVAPVLVQEIPFVNETIKVHRFGTLKSSPMLY